MQGDASPGEPLTVAHRSFEGLFVRALRLSGPALLHLRESGFDPAAPQPRYSARVWHDTRRAAARLCYPDLSEEHAHRALGRAFVEGFAQTVVGRVLGAAAPLLGTVRVLTRVPHYMRVARTDVEVSMEALETRHWRARFRESYPLPHFVAGAFEGMLGLTGVDARAAVTASAVDDFEVDIRW